MRNEIAIVLATAATVHVATRWYFSEPPRPLESAKRAPARPDEASRVVDEPRVVVVKEPCPTSPESDAGSRTDETCDRCLAAAQSGNITSAASFAGKCTDAGKKSACTNAARSPAQSAVKAQALNGQCAQAKATAQAGAAMGIKGLDKIIAKSGCN